MDEKITSKIDDEANQVLGILSAMLDNPPQVDSHVSTTTA